MPDRLTRAGTLAYAVVTLLIAAEVVQVVRLDDAWGGGRTWAAAVLVGISLAMSGLFAAATITRVPLIESGDPQPADDRLLSRYGAWVVIGLTVLGVVVAAAGSLDAFDVWPNLPAVFAPFWVRRLEAAYFEGVEETRRAAAAARVEER
jgi:membrane associated rhomboid family serine protease